MTTTTRNKSRQRVLLVNAGEGTDWEELETHLKASGRTVMNLYVRRHDDQPPHVDLPRRIHEFELAVMVITPMSGGLDEVTTRRLVHLAGLLQGALGNDRVAVLTEGEVAGFLHKTPVKELPYAEGEIKTQFPEVSKLLETNGDEAKSPRSSARPASARPAAARQASPTDPWLKRFGLDDSSVGPEIWMILGVLVVLAALAGVIGYRVFSDPITDEATVSSDTIASSPTDGEDGVDTGGGQADGEQVASPSTSASTSASAGTDPADDTGPGGALGVEDGRFDGLPATCRISTTPGEIIPREVACEGIGGLRTEGFLGPWHSVISEVSMDPGVVGEVEIEPRPDATSSTRVQLQPVARQSLEPYDSLFGVQQLRFEFSANGQQVVLHQNSAGGGAQLILTFSLDL